jgi:hypothetical protein
MKTAMAAAVLLTAVAAAPAAAQEVKRMIASFERTLERQKRAKE